jgi:PEP-CTERM motif
MSSRKIVSLGLAALLAVAAGGSANPTYAGSVTYEIIADTTFADSGLIAGPGGYVDMQLNPSILPVPLTPPTVTATVFNATTDGTIGGYAMGTPTGDASGSLPTGVTLDNSQFAVANEVTQSFAVNSFFDVFVTFSGSEIGPGANGSFTGTTFSFTIYDNTLNTIGAQITVNPNGGVVDGTVVPTFMSPTVQVILANSVPEPSSVVLMGLGLASVVGFGVRRRKARAAA